MQMATHPHFLLLPLPLLFHLSLISSSSYPLVDSDVTSLLTFKSLLSDPTTTSSLLSSWSPSTSPCSSSSPPWLGVSCNPQTHRITHLVLENLNLSAPSSSLLPLSNLSSLRLLSLKSNLLSGPLPPFPSSLRLLFLSHNLLSGPLPPPLLPSLPRLSRLDLSFNLLSGPLPSLPLPLPRLLTLRLHHNLLSGPIPSLSLPHIRDLNLSSNSLSGPIPPSLSSFPPSSFRLNPRLCGPPLPSCKNFVSATPVVISSSPGSKSEAQGGGRKAGGGGGMSKAAVVAIVVGDFAALLVVSLLLFCYFWRKFAGRDATSRMREGEKIVYSSSPYLGNNIGYNAGGGFGGGGFRERGKMVLFEGTKRFELEDLLRASAEMLGKGGMGTAYKAVLDDGNAVAVKRLREVVGGMGGGGGRREFEGQMEVIGRMRHPNLVGLKAYYYARDEKLLVYEYMAGGSLFSLLHANRGPGRTPLNWTTRMRIAAGSACGLACIHHHHNYSNYSKLFKLVHGNIKSTNILLDKSDTPKLADFALAPLFPPPPPPPPPRSHYGYTAPETMLDPRRQFTQKADIYAFGVVLLEILTGKMVSEEVDLARWVQSVVREEWTAEVFDLELMRYKGVEEEMVGMLQVAMACVAVAPEQRPKIGQVLKMIEEIRSDGSPSAASYESYGDSADQSPCVSDETGTIASM